jgi:hypothetical protein
MIFLLKNFSLKFFICVQSLIKYCSQHTIKKYFLHFIWFNNLLWPNVNPDREIKTADETCNPLIKKYVELSLQFSSLSINLSNHQIIFALFFLIIAIFSLIGTYLLTFTAHKYRLKRIDVIILLIQLTWEIKYNFRQNLRLD